MHFFLGIGIRFWHRDRCMDGTNQVSYSPSTWYDKSLFIILVESNFYCWFDLHKWFGRLDRHHHCRRLGFLGYHRPTSLLDYLMFHMQFKFS